MKKSMTVLFASLLAAGLLAGCNSNNNNTIPGGGTNCGGPPNGVEVIYPKPNARRVPSGVGSVWIAAKPSLPVGNQYDFFVVQTNLNQQTTGPFVQTNQPIPVPHVSPPAGAKVYYSSFNYIIGPVQSVNLYWNIGGSACNPNVIVSSFSTATQ
jgi:predicted small secreted protein